MKSKSIGDFETIADVEDFFGSKGSQLLALVDKDNNEYEIDHIPTGKEKVKWTCANNESHTQITTMGNMLRNDREEFNCRSCGISKSKSPKNYNTFVNALKEEDWEMVSEKEEYKNTKTVMKVICHNSHSTKLSYANWSNGHRSCVECGNGRKHTIEGVAEEFKMKGFELLEEKYINNATKMKYICKCGREGLMTYGNFLKNVSGCKNCTRRYTSLEIFEYFKQVECTLIMAADSANQIRHLIAYVLGLEEEENRPLFEFHSFPEFVLNSSCVFYICCCDNMHYTTWRLFKNGARCKECTTRLIEATCLDRYGAVNPFGCPAVQDKCKETMLERYNVASPMEDRQFVEKAKATNIRNHGGVHNTNLPEHREKIRNTNQKNYGVDFLFQSEEFRRKVENDNLQKYGNKNFILSNEGKNLMIERYGEPYAMQNAEIFEKAQKTARSRKKFTFPSGREVFVQGYEPFALRDLIEEGVNEDDIIVCKDIPKVLYFYEDKKRRYYTDIYIKSKDLMIEIKSTYTLEMEIDKNIAKFQAAAKLHNFELWVYSDKGIIISKKAY